MSDLQLSLVEEEIHLTASSDPENGAINIAPDKSSFILELRRPIIIPPTAVDPVISLEAATVWWTTPNVTSNRNDRIVIHGESTAGVAQTYTVTLTEGLWSITALNLEIHRQLEALGARVNPLPLISMTGNNSTQRTEISFNYNTVSIDFMAPRSIVGLLGFTPAVYGPFAVTPHVEESTAIASITPLDFYQVSCSLVDDGIRHGDQYRKIIGQIPISVPAGYQIRFEPLRPPKLPATLIKGQSINSIYFALLDHRLFPAHTGGQDWSVRIAIKYKRRFAL